MCGLVERSLCPGSWYSLSSGYTAPPFGYTADKKGGWNCEVAGVQKEDPH